MIDKTSKRRVYAIKCTKNKKMYIGITKRELEDRILDHLYSLRNGNHFNKSLQTDFDEYGESSFKFYLLEDNVEYSECYKEQEYINKYGTYNAMYGYNKIKDKEPKKNIEIIKGLPENLFEKDNLDPKEKEE